MEENKEIGENSSTSRKRQLETEEPQTSKENRKMKLDEEDERIIKIKLECIEEKKGDLPALHYAARVSGVDVCRRLVEQGADVNEKCSELGATPLHYAAMNTIYGIGLINYFLEKGCDINAEDAHGEKAINYAVKAENYSHTKHLSIE